MFSPRIVHVEFIVENVAVSQVSLRPLRFPSGSAINDHTHLTTGSGAIGPYEVTLQRDLVFIPPQTRNVVFLLHHSVWFTDHICSVSHLLIGTNPRFEDPLRNV